MIAAALLEDLGGTHEGEAFIRLEHAQVIAAAGGDGRDAIVAARARLLDRASRIADPAVRSTFLSNVPEHALTIELAAAWAGGTPS